MKKKKKLRSKNMKNDKDIVGKIKLGSTHARMAFDFFCEKKKIMKQFFLRSEKCQEQLI